VRRQFVLGPDDLGLAELASAVSAVDPPAGSIPYSVHESGRAVLIAHVEDAGVLGDGLDGEPLLASLLSEASVAVPLGASSRASVLKGLVSLAEQSWQVYDPEAVLDAVRQREEMASTALPSGVAIPHPRRPLSAALGESVLAYARTASPIPFGASQGVLTDMFFLVCCRDDRTHLRVLARLTRAVGLRTPDQGPANGGLRKNITVTGDITMQVDPQTCNCTNSPDDLGLIANNVVSNVPSQTGVNRTIEAAIFAGNKTEYGPPAEQDGSYETQYGAGGAVCGGNVPLEGSLTVYGSLVNNYTAPLGCFDPSSGKLIHGWADSYKYDKRFNSLLPPFYPLEYHYAIVAWQDEGVQ